MPNLQFKESNPWNPFEPTQRDIQRTNELSQKNPVVAGILTFLLLPVGMIYLNRAVNPLKILGCALLLGFSFGAFSESEEKAYEIGEKIGFICNIAMVVEQVNTVNKARQRNKMNEQ